jgi:16S rRNA (guanine527-N7)-methyltransferase
VALPPDARSALADGAAALAVPLSSAQLDALDRYVGRLLEWNAKVNLTAVTEPRAIVDKHLLDALALVPQLTGTRVLDVGTGPGLPAVVLAIARPELSIVAVESIHKKVAFVRAVSRELGLTIAVEPVRLEDRPMVSEFDIAVSRATFEPAQWVSRGAGFVRPGGRLLAMLSAQQEVSDPPAGFGHAQVIEHSIGGAMRRIAVYLRQR